MWTGALDLVSRATAGTPAEGGGGAGAGEAELTLLMLPLPRLSWDKQGNTPIASLPLFSRLECVCVCVLVGGQFVPLCT